MSKAIIGICWPQIFTRIYYSLVCDCISFTNSCVCSCTLLRRPSIRCCYCTFRSYRMLKFCGHWNACFHCQKCELKDVAIFANWQSIYSCFNVNAPLSHTPGQWSFWCAQRWKWKMDFCQQMTDPFAETYRPTNSSTNYIRIQWICNCLFTLQHMNESINQMRNFIYRWCRPMIHRRNRWTFIDVNSNYTRNHVIAHTLCWWCRQRNVRVGSDLRRRAPGELRIVFVGWVLRFQFSFRLNSSDLLLTSYRSLWWWGGSQAPQLSVKWADRKGNNIEKTRLIFFFRRFTPHVSLSSISLHKQTKFLGVGVGHYIHLHVWLASLYFVVGTAPVMLLLCPVPTDEK